MNRKYYYLILISSLIICIDQLTKLFIHTQFQLMETVVVIQNFFNITYVRNPGAAFGFLAQSHPEFRTWFFLIMPPVALLIIIFILRGVSERDKVQIYALSFIFGGAVGNYIDRLRFRYVIDFLDFHVYNKYSWPAFNIADSMIVIGVGLLMYLMVQESRAAKLSGSQAQTEQPPLERRLTE